jgi:hypothetical protein
MSNRQIAKVCNVSYQYVNNLNVQPDNSCQPEQPHDDGLTPTERWVAALAAEAN